MPELNWLLRVWSAVEVHINRKSYLELPPSDINGTVVRWDTMNDGNYPSNKLYIRDSYRTAATHLLAYSQSCRAKNRSLNLMLMSGSSGIGKSYFVPYLIWRLFHPDGEFVKKVPETIVWRLQAGDNEGYVYHNGFFYKSSNLSRFFITSKTWLDEKDAWIIYDGSAPANLKSCNTLAVISPGVLESRSKANKEFVKSTACRVFLPPWSYEETVEVAQAVYNFDASLDFSIRSRYRRYGGIPRYVLQYLNAQNQVDPLVQALCWSNVLRALIQAGTQAIDHSQVTGTLLHIIPDETLCSFNYEWGSTEIMEEAFKTLFQISKNKVSCSIPEPIALNVGTFYGLLFKPYFHSCVGRQGFSGKCRRLMSETTSATSTVKKLNIWGTKVNKLETITWRIPRMDVHRFDTILEIEPTKYNIPNKPKSLTIDAVCPVRCEIFQVTSENRHDIKGSCLTELYPVFAPYLKTGQKVKFIIIVPPDIFLNYQVQRIVDSKGKGPVKDMNIAWIEQHVIKVDASPLIHSFDKKMRKLIRKEIEAEKIGLSLLR